MKVDLKSLFGLHATWCAQLYLLADTRNSTPSPAFWLLYGGSIGQQNTHIFL